MTVYFASIDVSDITLDSEHQGEHELQSIGDLGLRSEEVSLL